MGTSINFDNLPDGTILSRQYSSIELTFTSSPLIQEHEVWAGTSRPKRVLAAINPAPSERVSYQIEGWYDVGQAVLALNVGRDRYDSYESVWLCCYGYGGTMLQRRSVELQPGTPEVSVLIFFPDSNLLHFKLEQYAPDPFWLGIVNANVPLPPNIPDFSLHLLGGPLMLGLAEDHMVKVQIDRLNRSRGKITINIDIINFPAGPELIHIWPSDSDGSMRPAPLKRAKKSEEGG